MENPLSVVYQTLDDVHSSASEGRLNTSPQESVSILRAIIFTAQETINEVEEQRTFTRVTIVEKAS